MRVVETGMSKRPAYRHPGLRTRAIRPLTWPAAHEGACRPPRTYVRAVHDRACGGLSDRVVRRTSGKQASEREHAYGLDGDRMTDLRAATRQEPGPAGIQIEP